MATYDLLAIHNYLKLYNWCELDEQVQFQSMYYVVEWSIDMFAYITGADSTNDDTPIIKTNFAEVLCKCIARVLVEYIKTYGDELPAEELLYIASALIVAITITNTDHIPSAKYISVMTRGDIDALEVGRVLRNVMNLIIADEVSLVF
jgi:hypothetical protein